VKKLLLAFLLVSPIVFAYQSKDFDWIPPTERVDGAPLADSEIAAYRILCNGSQVVEVPNTGGTNSWQSPDGAFPPGDYSCTARTVDTAGLVSEDSAPVVFTVDPAAPNPPSGLSVVFE